MMTAMTQSFRPGFQAGMCSFLLAVVTVGLLPSRVSAADRPNVLFFAVDDMNDWIGCMGPQTSNAQYRQTDVTGSAVHKGQPHAVSSHHFRYIRYSTGEEELYDHRKDPNEWDNLAGNPEYRKIIKELQNKGTLK